MNVRQHIAKHPLHPMLTPLPLAAIGFVLIADVMYAFTGSERWFGWSRSVLIAAAVLELLALVARSADYFGRSVDDRATRLAAVQGVVNVAVVGLFGLSAFVRSHGLPAEQFPSAALTLILALLVWGLSLALAQKTEDELPFRIDARKDATSLQSI